jgi:hypothetical protein
MKLLAEPIGEPTEVDPQLVIQTAELAQLDDERLIDLKQPQPLGVSTKRIGEHIGISPIVFGSRRAVTVAEAVELFWVDAEDDETTLEQTLDQRTPTQLDRDSDLLRLETQLQQSRSELVDSFGTVFDRKFGEFYSLMIENTDLVRVIGPVDPCKQSITGFHFWSPPDGESRTAAVLHRPCTGALGATPHGMCTLASPPGRTSTPGALGARAPYGVPGGWPVVTS